MVLKPAEGYGGRDVKIGREEKLSEWKRVLRKAMHGAEKWVVQEYVPIPKMTTPILVKGSLRMVTKKLNLNPFVFSGRLYFYY